MGRPALLIANDSCCQAPGNLSRSDISHLVLRRRHKCLPMKTRRERANGRAVGFSLCKRAHGFVLAFRIPPGHFVANRWTCAHRHLFARSAPHGRGNDRNGRPPEKPLRVQRPHLRVRVWTRLQPRHGILGRHGELR